MPRAGQTFLRRWSRLKREAAATPAATATKHGSRVSPDAPAAELPSLESLSFESDFRVFMRARIDEGIRRAALKKLFRDPRFNVMDGLDVYIDDYSKEDPIAPGILAQLRHARTTLFGAQAQGQEPTPSGTPAADRPDEDSEIGRTTDGAAP